MSRPRSHRKSMSTSALSVLAGSRERDVGERDRMRHSARSPLEAVSERDVAQSDVGEGSSSSAVRDMSDRLERRKSAISAGDKERRKERRTRDGQERPAGDLRGYLEDLRSLRSSTRRRIVAVRGLERGLLAACERGQPGDFVELRVHVALLALLARHTSTLTRRSSSALAAGDEVGMALAVEIEATAGVLQGMCLLSRSCKDAVGQRWILELATDTRKPVAFALLELLFCVLVDRPDHARAFEALGGLEAVTRVLKGTGVAKEVRMKCIEFLYFYLLPENTGQRSASGASSSSTSSSDSLYPPLPLDVGARARSRMSMPPPASPAPSATPSSPSKRSKRWDVDVPFVPQTPRKPQTPALGFPTPSARRVSGGTANGNSSMSSAASTPRLPVPPSPSLRRDLGSDERPHVGLGLGRLAKDSSTSPIDAEAARSMVSSATPVATSTSHPSASFTDPFSRSASSGSGNSSHSSATIVPSRPADADASPKMRVVSSGSSSGDSSSGSLPGARRQPRPSLASAAPGAGLRLPRSSTQPSLAGPLNGPLARQSSRRISRSPLAHSVTPELPEQGQHESGRDVMLPASSSAARLPSHARRPSDLAALAMPPPTRTSSPAAAETPKPRKPRAFPAELTRGLPSSSSTPNLAGLARAGKTGAAGGATPLGPARRVSGRVGSGTGSSGGDKSRDKENGVLRSVDEKKELLSAWLGNVDQLVQGVQRAGIWGELGG